VEWGDIPDEIRDRYQYFTQAEMGRLRAAGYDRPFRSVEEGVADYVSGHLGTEDPYR
jgi:ADP-L-glycero-D-manno-heptose 6-epimerase